MNNDDSSSDMRLDPAPSATSASVKEQPTSTSVTTVDQRLREEAVVLVRQLPILLLCAAHLLYFCLGVFRNLAFLRYRPADSRLKDLGFEIFPQMPQYAKKYTDVPMRVMELLFVSLLLSCIFGNPKNPRKQKPFAASLIRRFTCMYTIAHTIRFTMYIGTSLPGSADHCLYPLVNEAFPPPPENVFGAFFKRFALTPGNNCGDLVFSGHTMQMTLFACMIWRYGRQVFGLTHRKMLLLKFFTIILITCQVCLILASRNHYTVDVVVALYFTPLFFYFYTREIQPRDLAYDVALESRIPKFLVTLIGASRERGAARWGENEVKTRPPEGLGDDEGLVGVL